MFDLNAVSYKFGLLRKLGKQSNLLGPFRQTSNGNGNSALNGFGYNFEQEWAFLDKL
jgi:hypothetical protein